MFFNRWGWLILLEWVVKLYRDNIHENNHNNNNNTNSFNLYYKNQMHKNYKLDEQIITNIIHRHIKPIEHHKQIKRIIYYTKFKTPNLTNQTTQISPNFTNSN